jgi:capsular exopolysaccharide synthesis family protein
VSSQIQTLDARIAALDRLRAAGSADIAAAPAAETQEQELSDRVQSIRSTAAQLQGELQKAQMAEAVEAGQVQIVQLASRPGSRLATGHLRKLLIGLLVGLMLGFGASVLADTLDASIRKRSDIERVLGIPSLGVIPRLSQHGNHAQRLRRVLPRAARRGQRVGLGHARDLITVSETRSVAAEAFRTLRTNLMFSQSVGAIRTLVVTSASPGEGKTTTASNLAVSFAQQGMRVLLIDGDLRRARLHRLFDIPREPGFSDLLTGDRNEDEVTSSTTVPGLYLMPSGTLPHNPVELLGAERTAKTLASLTEGYDIIVLDTPPLLAASDAAVLATVANGVVLVLRAGATQTSAAQQAVEQLTSIGAHVVGAVLNDPDTQLPRYGAYYKYDYSAVEG